MLLTYLVDEFIPVSYLLEVHYVLCVVQATQQRPPHTQVLAPICFPCTNTTERTASLDPHFVVLEALYQGPKSAKNLTLGEKGGVPEI